ncbi:ABC transporter ATP-binding protein [Glutamicibacter sp. BW80]|uniref:ATP-binding cassette domain-containing protein n=1 Tax=unclassified Glutamicibacter TaxID=2627139 RepID=UPI000BB93F75|nr:ATP-binding cassette domain-containing protein [Glutamicibacter sp. BW80]PCC27542.1 ABC transporter ATP-binding protein [Glutamicibacter sp. BW80]
MTVKSTLAQRATTGHALGQQPNTGLAAPASPLICLKNARVTAVRQQQTLLEIDELALFPGERLVITGPSGSGKSLLLATLTGRWAAGLAFTGTRTVDFTRIGLIPQRGLDALHPLLPLARQLRKVTGKSVRQVHEALTAVGLSDPALSQRRPAELSGGQAQRAAVALAVLSEAPLILADEPTSALDHESRDQTLALLDRVITARQALVVVTHDPAVAEVLATRRLALESGKVITSAGPAKKRART